jgi:phytoene desaturase
MGAWSKIYDVGFTKLSAVPILLFYDKTILTSAAPVFRKRVVNGCRVTSARQTARRAFSIQPLLLGGNPFSTTAIYGMINHLEREHGVWFCHGWDGALVNAFERLMVEEGIKSPRHYIAQIRSIMGVKPVSCLKR